MPIESAPDATAHSALHRGSEGALVVDAPDFGTLRVSGPDRKSWLNGLLTCDLKKLMPGDAMVGFCLSKVGKIQAELVVLDAGDGLLLGLPKLQLETVRAELDHHLIMEDAELTEVSAEFGWAFAHGASATLVRDRARALGASAASLNRTGLGGCAVAFPQDLEPALRAAWSSLPGVQAADAETWLALRCATFVPAFGVDFDDRNNPHEASLERVAVAFDKGCYLGQEAVCMLEMRGQAKKRLVQLELPVDALRGDPLVAPDGADAGVLTSVSPLVEGGLRLGIGSVKRALAVEGQELRVHGQRALIRALAPGVVRL